MSYQYAPDDKPERETCVCPVCKGTRIDEDEYCGRCEGEGYIVIGESERDIMFESKYKNE